MKQGQIKQPTKRIIPNYKEGSDPKLQSLDTNLYICEHKTPRPPNQLHMLPGENPFCSNKTNR